MDNFDNNEITNNPEIQGSDAPPAQPEQPIQQPEAPAAQPEQQYQQPDGQYAQPNQQYQQPDGQYTQPEQQYQQPDGQYAQPEQQYQHPDGQYAQPNQQYQQPDGQYAQPNQQYQQYQQYDQQYQYQQPPVVAPYPLKSKMAAGLLGIFLGCFGVHNFYLGYTGKAVAQLLIAVLTCGVGAIVTSVWGLIEGILILTGSIAVDGKGYPLAE